MIPKAWPVIAALATGVLVAGIAAYALWPRGVTDGGDATRKSVAAPREGPGKADGRPGESERSHIFNRQVVYYRTVHPVGTVLVAKAQRFLYLVVSNVSAVRYTVGVGRECAKVAGLLVVSAKEDWSRGPGQAASDRQPGGRFGARSLALGDTGYRIHGTAAPTTSGEADCFSLVNEDVIHLYDRVPVGTRVVIN